MDAKEMEQMMKDGESPEKYAGWLADWENQQSRIGKAVEFIEGQFNEAIRTATTGDEAYNKHEALFKGVENPEELLAGLNEIIRHVALIRCALLVHRVEDIPNGEMLAAVAVAVQTKKMGLA